MEKINDDWNKIYRLSKVYLKDDLETECLSGKVTLKKGFYFISGFWLNVMGLTTTLKDARDLNNKWVIASINLKHFYK